MIYFVEDDASIRELVLYTLNNAGFQAEGFERPSAFWKAVGQMRPTLILLDIMLPEEDGLSILRKLRADPDTRATPVMMLTAKGTEYDTVLALDAGADDYVQKPFRMMELLSRIRALIRRSEGYGTPAGAVEYQAEHLEVSPARHLVRVDGKDVTLTLKEFELLCLLLSEQETVFTRAQLLDRIWKIRGLYCPGTGFWIKSGGMPWEERAGQWMFISGRSDRNWGLQAAVLRRSGELVIS